MPDYILAQWHSDFLESQLVAWQPQVSDNKPLTPVKPQFINLILTVCTVLVFVQMKHTMYNILISEFKR